MTLDGMAKAIATFERVAALSGNSKYDKIQCRRQQGPDRQREARNGLVRPDAQHRRRVQESTRSVRRRNARSVMPASTSPTSSFTTWESAGTKRPGNSPTWGGGPSIPSAPRAMPAWGRSRLRSVRDVEHNAPYMHDGSLATLEEVVDHYDKGGIANPALDPDMKKLGLTAQEKKDVVAFMKALSGETKKLDELLPKLPPDSGGKAPDPGAALTPPSKTVAAVLFHPAAGARSTGHRSNGPAASRSKVKSAMTRLLLARQNAGSLSARTGQTWPLPRDSRSRRVSPCRLVRSGC